MHKDTGSVPIEIIDKDGEFTLDRVDSLGVAREVLEECFARIKKLEKQWVSVDDDTPEIVSFNKYSEDILVWCDPFIHTAYYQVGREYRRKDDGCHLDPTHWIYFPEPPKDKRKISKENE
jgi:hypothetical protein|tara:strand:+ start:847 stop:1206 length:360 start_codon:yes stop_codon:yes gene_type:complete